MANLSVDDLKKLKCNKCKNYLSVPPITVIDENFFCGRCNTPGTRNTPFEVLAENVLFPCKNDLHGCIEQILFEKMLSHEAGCKYDSMECPFCHKSHLKTTLKQHFKDKHLGLTVDGSISLPRNEDRINFMRLMVVGQEFYIVEISGCKEKFFVTLNTVFEPTDVTYNLVIKSNTNKILLGQRKIISFGSVQNQDNVLNDEQIKSFLNCEDYSFEIEISRKDTKDLEFLEELECIICQEYMMPPIYLCRKGHSLCGSCKSKISRCPSCKSVFQGGRNFALEKIAEKIFLFCKNQPDCSFTGSSEEMKKHEEAFLCPLKSNLNCQWSGPSCGISKHVKVTHSEVLFVPLKKSEDISLEVAIKSHEEVIILAVDNNHFKLSMLVRKRKVHCKIEHVELKADDEPKYLLNFELLNLCKGRSIINRFIRCGYLDDNCSCSSNNADNALSMSLMSGFITGYGLFRCDINIREFSQFDLVLEALNIYMSMNK